MKITKDISSHIVFDAQQDLMHFVSQKMAEVERQETDEQKYRWRAYFDVLDYLERYRYEKEYEVSDKTTTEIEQL